MKASAVARDMRILIIGPSGSGKTHFIGTLAQVMPTLYVTADPTQVDTLQRIGVDPDTVLLEEWHAIWDYYEAIRRGVSTYKALAVDDLASAQWLARRKVEFSPRGRDEERLPEEARRVKIFQEMLRGSRRMVGFDTWGELYTAFGTFIDALLALPYPVKVFTVTEDVAEHPRTGKAHIYPALDGTIRRDLCARFSLVLSSFVAEVDGHIHYCLTSRPHPYIETKDRYGVPRTWVNPTAAQVILHVKGGENDTESELERRIGIGL